MIKSVAGKVLSKGPLSIVLDVSGWGLEVMVSDPSLFQIDDSVRLFTHLAVRQDGPELYGFSDPEDLRFFELTLSVSGVGPKTALSLLKRASRQNLEAAIGKRDLSYLTNVVGLGKKSAEKLMVEIGEKMQLGPAPSAEDTEVFDTLV